MEDLRIWIKGLMAAVIHGAAITVTAVIVDPSKLRFCALKILLVCSSLSSM